MAAHHIDRMRSVQPHGPYMIGGMCAGGVIAFEIARQLQSQGEKIAVVALLDAADSKATPKPWHFASQRVRSFSTAFHQEEGVRFDRMALTIVLKSVSKAKNLITYLVGHGSNKLRDNIRVSWFRYHVDRGLQLPRALEQIPVRTIYVFAEKGYQPGGCFDGELALFRATDGDGADEPCIERYDDPLLGWGQRATRGLRVYDIPGGHSSMLQTPHVSILAAHLQSYIDYALKTEPASRRTPSLVSPCNWTSHATAH